MHQPTNHCSAQGAAKGAMVAQRGVSLIMVMLIMVVVSMLGINGVQIAMMAERGSRNDRDMQIAFQAAEAALIDAEFDITGKDPGKKRSVNPFDKNNARIIFLPDCAGSGDSLGLCAEKTNPTEVPDWLKVDFTDTSTSAKTVEFGKFTGRAFPVGAGIQPYQKPRYIIELINDAKSKEFTPYFRITAMGFGPRQDIQVVLQTVYRN